ncbi:unnamed protein product [Hermetia illucens]|uniref:Uncharacterized protein n=1 Tax=Hermetia illucens TaxID=343691 RepID=A0A7R8UGB8_HERIL|nr:unnamed protein product [Hermetia illucens]
MLFFLAALVIYFATPTSSQSYPVFGTKRYHRASNNVQMPVPASLVANPSYYNTPPKYYYDQRPAYAVPTYHETYPDDNPYYYYPRQEYYGMPIYHGEYKPSSYYYAHAPSYSYYDDREVGTNPMDDLHEEILQEDERERQRELYPVAQEGWYEGDGGQQDELTNNFLRNLIAYNKQINAQEQQQQQEQMAIEQNEPKPHQDYQNDRTAPMYEDEYADYASSEYEYVPEQTESFSAKKFSQMEPEKYEKYSDVEDENERQLKFLAHRQKSQSLQNNQHKHQPSHWDQQASPKSGHHNQNKATYAEEETGPEYEDDTWINWDRKRSGNTQMKIFPQPQKDESIEAFTNRKPTLFVGKPSSTVRPVVGKEPSKTASSTSTSSTTTTTSTMKPKHSGIFTGQKEVVLPRPAGSFPRSMFVKPLQNAAQTEGLNAVQETPEKAQNGVKSSAGVYDTIKQLIAMQQQFQQVSL